MSDHSILNGCDLPKISPWPSIASTATYAGACGSEISVSKPASFATPTASSASAEWPESTTQPATSVAKFQLA